MSGSVFFPSSSPGDGGPLFGGPNSKFTFSSDPGEGPVFDLPSPNSPAYANTGSVGSIGKSSDGRGGSASKAPSLLFRDLSGAPVGQSAASNGQPDLATAAAATALWQNSSPGTRHPAPPLTTLDDLNVFSFPSPLQAGSGFSVEFSGRGSFTSPPSKGAGFECGGHHNFQNPISTEGNGEKENSPDFRARMFGQGSLLSVTPPSNVIQPPQSSQGDTNSSDHWVTVFGFTAEQTNMVLSEFEKCGPIVDHVYGPAGANWIHIRYQSPYNAQRALSKCGVQLSSSLIVGVKPIHQSQLDSLKGKVSSLHETRSIVTDSNAFGGGLGLASARPYLLNGSGKTATHPTKSRFSRVTDLLFGS